MDFFKFFCLRTSANIWPRRQPHAGGAAGSSATTGGKETIQTPPAPQTPLTSTTGSTEKIHIIESSTEEILPVGLDKLPTELLIEIFADLDYFTLNKIIRPVCRRFNDLVDSAPPELRETLYRRRHTQAKRKGKGIEDEDVVERCFALHPCIRRLQMKQDDDGSILTGFVHPSPSASGSTFTPVNSYPAALEDALSAPLPFSEAQAGALPFVLCKGADESLTVSEFAADVLERYVSNATSCSRTLPRDEAGCVPLFTALDLESNIPRRTMDRAGMVYQYLSFDNGVKVVVHVFERTPDVLEWDSEDSEDEENDRVDIIFGPGGMLSGTGGDSGPGGSYLGGMDLTGISKKLGIRRANPMYWN